jgi:hypothetical protein
MVVLRCNALRLNTKRALVIARGEWRDDAGRRGGDNSDAKGDSEVQIKMYLRPVMLKVY